MILNYARLNLPQGKDSEVGCDYTLICWTCIFRQTTSVSKARTSAPLKLNFAIHRRHAHSLILQMP